MDAPMPPRDPLTELHEAQKRATLERIARALERLAPPPPHQPDFSAAEAFVWQSEPEAFMPIAQVNRVPIELLKSVTAMRDTLLANTERFARGLPANNALLWGARGMGKSSLVKAVHADVRARVMNNGGGGADLKLVEIHREDIATLPACLSFLRGEPHRFIVFCDDLSFDSNADANRAGRILKKVFAGK